MSPSSKICQAWSPNFWKVLQCTRDSPTVVLRESPAKPVGWNYPSMNWVCATSMLVALGVGASGMTMTVGTLLCTVLEYWGSYWYWRLQKMMPAFMTFLFIGRSCSLILTHHCKHRESVGGWSKGLLNARGPPQGGLVPVVHLVHSDLF